jgi:flagellar assembly factor FliW
MKQVFETLRFGQLEVRTEDIIQLPEGLLGFSRCTRFVVLEDPAQAPFMWLQSLDNTDLGFVVVDPLTIVPDYQIQVPREEVEELELEDPRQARIFVMVVVPEDLKDVSANLKGPIVVNPNNRLGKQLVLMDDRYPTQYFFMRENSQSSGNSS